MRPELSRPRRRGSHAKDHRRPHTAGRLRRGDLRRRRGRGTGEAFTIAISSRPRRFASHRLFIRRQFSFQPCRRVGRRKSRLALQRRRKRKASGERLCDPARASRRRHAAIADRGAYWRSRFEPPALRAASGHTRAPEPKNVEPLGAAISWCALRSSDARGLSIFRACFGDFLLICFSAFRPMFNSAFSVSAESPFATIAGLARASDDCNSTSGSSIGRGP